MKFPKILNINATSISNDLISVKPMTDDEVIQGRLVKEYPVNYDSFESLASLKRFIISKSIEPRINVGLSVLMPFNLEPDIYYPHKTVIKITAAKPQQERTCFEEYLLDITLNKDEWVLEELSEMVKNIQTL